MINLVPVNTSYEKAQSAIYLLNKYAKKIDSPKTVSVIFLEDINLLGDAYRIVSGDEIRVFGNTSVSFNAAVGYLVRHQSKGIESKTTTFNSSLRASYFANHFYNFYHSAPVEEILEYLESLALWGQSALCLWFDMHHFNGISDTDAEAMLLKMESLFKKAKSLGMKTSLMHLGNEYYKGAPKDILAENSTESGRYKLKLSGYYYTELCPSNPDGEKFLLSSFDELMCRFSSVGLDYIMIWPYDQGGCTCEKCYPWGSNGFFKIAKKKAEIAKKYFPDSKIIFSCWRFDYFTDTEWKTIIPLIKKDGDWIDHIMIDIDAYIPDDITSLDKPIIAFPEVSMYLVTPWGGFGANPFPKALSNQFKKTKDFLKGGALYSEGIFEDINKVVALELMRDPYVDIKNVIEDYAGYYFGEKWAKSLGDIIIRLEETLARSTYLADGRMCDYPTGTFTKLHKYVIKNPENIESILEDFLKIDKEIPSDIREGHRYQSLYARVLGDAVLLRNGGIPNEETDKLYLELVRLYHAEKAYYFVSPITRESILKNRGEGV